MNQETLEHLSVAVHHLECVLRSGEFVGVAKTLVMRAHGDTRAVLLCERGQTETAAPKKEEDRRKTG
jgi:hypothetical protein